MAYFVPGAGYSSNGGYVPGAGYVSVQVLDARYGRPNADLSAGAWTPSTGGSLYAMVDESTASDTDYISASSASTCSLGLNGVVDPASSSGHVVRYRAKNNGSGSVTVLLKQGTTTIASQVNNSLTTSYADYSFTLSGAEADSITDYTNLKIELTSS